MEMRSRAILEDCTCTSNQSALQKRPRCRRQRSGHQGGPRGIARVAPMESLAGMRSSQERVHWPCLAAASIHPSHPSTPSQPGARQGPRPWWDRPRGRSRSRPAEGPRRCTRWVKKNPALT
ncbi:hypothetical protein VFPFJ_03830 [Purpureocillium lilacinum]|uniref:Uncharacterized protein n=1 Tax=Purpureocillium lilacinum TaxID=33203 RepID=A0A179HRM6_PURLI|nr:hypothetical protein VFPFJ_03830 [Purpureocillium lilacinum]OAQ92090.1 hypothetical protein VFPFJ_03830 [Purpureocillium lilacinum]